MLLLTFSTENETRYRNTPTSQQIFTCSKSTLLTVLKAVKYVESLK